MSDLQVKDAKVDTGKVICLRAEQELKTRQTPSFTLSTTWHHQSWMSQTFEAVVSDGDKKSSLYGIYTTFCFLPQTPVFVQNTLNDKMQILFENQFGNA